MKPIILFPEFSKEIKQEADIVKMLTNNKIIKKEAEKSKITMKFLIKHFWLHHTSIQLQYPYSGWQNLIFFDARFCIDAYAFCRIMKNEKIGIKIIYCMGEISMLKI